MKNISKCLVYVLSLTLASISFAQEEDGWINVTKDRLKTMEGWFEGNNIYNKRVSTVACDPRNGDAYLILPSGFGIWKSTDQFKSWEKVESELYTGRMYGGHSYEMDAETGRLAIFSLRTTLMHPDGTKNRQEAQAVITEDGGETWRPINKPDVGKGGKKGRHDGWTWGAIDWTQSPVKTMFCKEHHTLPGNLWITHDGGQTWKRTTNEGRHLGLIGSDILLLGRPEEGIYRSTDDGQTWDKVSDYVPGDQTTVRYGDKTYWTSGDAVIVTDDGTEWQQWGNKLPGRINFGPYFGRSSDEAMVVVHPKEAESGVYVTRDAGETWTKVINSRKGMRESYAWDPIHNIIYFARMGDDSDLFMYKFAD